METRQVIIMRTDLDMSVGKMIAQGAHASEGALREQIIAQQSTSISMDDFTNMQNWNLTGRTKIVLGVGSLEKLQNLVKRAQDIGINTYVVKDEGRTELNEPTVTCACLGVDTKQTIDRVTRRLRLLKLKDNSDVIKRLQDLNTALTCAKNYDYVPNEDKAPEILENFFEGVGMTEERLRGILNKFEGHSDGDIEELITYAITELL